MSRYRIFAVVIDFQEEYITSPCPPTSCDRSIAGKTMVKMDAGQQRVFRDTVCAPATGEQEDCGCAAPDSNSLAMRMQNLMA